MRKKIWIGFAAGLFIALSPGLKCFCSESEGGYYDLKDAYSDSNAARTKVCLNGLWHFQPVTEEQKIPPASGWGFSKVPGNWKITHGSFFVYDSDMKLVKQWNDKPFSNYTMGWYQREVSVPGGWRDKKVFIKFDSFQVPGKIYINGQHISDVAPQITTLVDISGHAGEKIILSVFVWMPGVTGPETHRTGLCMHDVWLEAYSSSVFVEGVIIKPSVRKKSLNVDVDINSFDRAKNTVIISGVIKHDNTVVKSFELKPFVLSGEKTETVRLNIPWEDAILWSPENPYLYSLRISIKTPKGDLLDETFSEAFGFREFWIERGDFCLNGQKTHLRAFYSGLYDWLHRQIDKEALTSIIRGYKALGFNTMSLINYSRPYGTHANYLNYIFPIADKEGMMISCQAPDLIAGGYDEWANDLKFRKEYEERVRSFMHQYGNSPSIIMWHVNMNEMPYNFLQPSRMTGRHVQRLPFNNLDIGSKRRMSLEMEDVFKKYDVSRPIMQYGSGNTGQILTNYLYLGFGCPLQEAEDWPSAWDSERLKPFISLETGFPILPQWYQNDKFRSGNIARGEPALFVENAARYIGQSAYGMQEKAIRDAYASFPQSFYDLHYLTVKALFAKNQFRSWRTYGMSGITSYDNASIWYYPEPTPYRRGDELSYFQRKWGNLKIPGPKPDVEFMQWAEDYDFANPTILGKAIKETFSPVLIYLGGEKEKFSSKDHSFYAGEEVEKQIIAVNDKMGAIALPVDWKVVDFEGKIYTSGVSNIKAAPGEIAKMAFDFIAPSTETRKEYKIRLSSKEAGNPVVYDEFPIQIFPVEKKLILKESVALYDDVGLTTLVLDAAGIQYKRIWSAEEVEGYRTFIIGRECLDEAGNRLLEKIIQNGAVDRGLNVLCFEQRSCKALGLDFFNTNQRYTYILDGKHPAVRGLAKEDFINWRGSGDMVPPYPEPAPETESEWSSCKWGNQGIVSTFVIRKPQIGNFRSIIESGCDLIDTPLLEWKRGKGKVVFCQMDVTTRYGKDPAATRLADNLIEYCNVPPEEELQPAFYLGGNGGKETLDALGISYKDIKQIKEVRQNGVLIIGECPHEDLVSKKEEIKTFAGSGGTVFCLPGCVKTRDFSDDWLPFPLKAERKNIFKAVILTEDEPIMRGLGNSDFFWRYEYDIPCFAQYPQGSSLLEPALICKMRYGKGYYIFSLIEPGILSKPDAYWKEYTAAKIYRITSTILTNLNITSNATTLSAFELTEMKFKTDPENIGEGKWSAQDYDDSSWQTLKVPGFWEKQGITEANPYMPGDDKWQYNGYAWYRKTLTVSESYKGKDLKLYIGAIDDYDWTYFNGRLIGKTGTETPLAYIASRLYPIPGKLINYGGKNVIAVRVFDDHGAGGFSKGPVILGCPGASPYVEKSSYNPDSHRMW